MNKRFFYSIILSVFIFTNCRKEDNKPEHNNLVIVDRSGNTTVTEPLSNTDISGSFDPSFGVSAETPSGDYRLNIGQFKAYVPSSITFTSPAYSNNIGMYISYAAGSWAATGGNVDIESKSGSPLYGTGGTQFMKLTFNNVQFTLQSTYSNQNPPADTIWVSGVINAYR
jgi:hypothetical protein